MNGASKLYYSDIEAVKEDPGIKLNADRKIEINNKEMYMRFELYMLKNKEINYLIPYKVKIEDAPIQYTISGQQRIPGGYQKSISFEFYDVEAFREEGYLEGYYEGTALKLYVNEENLEDVLEYLEIKTKPLPGDPLIEMEIVGSNEDNHSDNTGGMYGCVRFSRKDCSSKTNNLLDPSPKISGREQFHSGVDIKASVNTNLYSMYTGEVVKADFPLSPDQCSNTNKAGNVIIIKSENVKGKTIYVYYCHLNEKAENIKVGYEIKQGELMGKTGSTGNACGISDWRDHVHIIVYESSLGANNKVNPLDYFNTKFDKTNGNKIK